MTGVEWNKKEELLQDQALRHLKQYLPLFAAFTNNFKSEINLLNKIQEYCYDNMNFLKTFNKIILLLYKSKLFLLQKLEERSLLIYSSKPFTFNLCKVRLIFCAALKKNSRHKNSIFQKLKEKNQTQAKNSAFRHFLSKEYGKLNTFPSIFSK